LPSKRKPAPEPAPRRGNPPLKYNQSLAEAFGVHPSIEAPEREREVVRVDSLPDPPAVVVPGGPAPERETGLNAEEQAVRIFREEADEIGVRLGRFGIPFHPGQKQELVDHGMALLTGLVGGGTLVRR
jgi:hypothetical protein